MKTRIPNILLSILIVFVLVGLSSSRFTAAVRAAPPAQGAEAITINLSVDEEVESVGPGNTVTFTIAVKNTGLSTVENVKVINNLQDRFLQIENIEVKVRAGQQWEDGNSIKEDNLITWSIGELAANQEWSARYDAVIVSPLSISPEDIDTVAQTIPIVNEVDVHVDDIGVANDVETLNVKFPAESLTIEKEFKGADGIGADGSAVFHLSVKNLSDNFVFNNLTISDEFRGEKVQPSIKDTFLLDKGSLSDEIPYEINPDKITWTLDSIHTGGEWFVEYEVNMDPAFNQGNRQIFNSASLLVSGDEVIKIDQSEELTMQVKAPDFTLKRSFEHGEVSELRPGDTVTIFLEYQNVGTATATGVVLEETYDVNLVEENITVNDDGRVNGPSVVWELGTKEPGALGEVSYEVQIKSDLSSLELDSGNFIEMTNQANIRADDMDPIFESDPPKLVVRTPVIRISELNMEDLNGDLVNPGDRLRITIGVENTGTAAAAPLIIQARFDSNLFAKHGISNDGTQEGGLIKWELIELPAGASKTVYYDLIVNDDVPADTSANDDVVVFIGNTEAARSSVPIDVAMAPPPIPESSFQDIPSEQSNFPWIVAMIGGLILGSLLVLALASKKVFDDDKNPVGDNGDKEIRQQNFQQIVQMFTVLIIVGAVLILAMVSELGPTPAVGVLSGIAGYVLGSRSR